MGLVWLVVVVVTICCKVLCGLICCGCFMVIRGCLVLVWCGLALVVGLRCCLVAFACVE